MLDSNFTIGQLRNFHYKILFSDKSTFKSDGSVNTHNCRYWTQENSHSKKLTINVFGKSMFDVELSIDISLDRFSLKRTLLVVDTPILLKTIFSYYLKIFP